MSKTGGPTQVGALQQNKPDGGQRGHASHISAFKDERSVCNVCQISDKLTKKKLAEGFRDEIECMASTSPRNGRRW